MSKSEKPRDTVILRQYARGPSAPNLSPLPLKLETYLRMAEIPYENDFKSGMSRKGKTPWMTYNGEDVDDSQFCIEYLNRKLHIDLNNHLTDEQRAVALGFQRLAEDNLYWVLLVHRWIHDPNYIKSCIRHMLPGIMGIITNLLMPSRFNNQAWQQGTGRHSKEEVQQIGEADLKALSVYLGTKSYLMGSEPCEQDCTVFGHLVQFLWNCPSDSPYKNIITEKYPNLSDYCERMKAKYWPDWDECITHEYTKEATK